MDPKDDIDIVKQDADEVNTEQGEQLCKEATFAQYKFVTGIIRSKSFWIL